MVGNRICRRFRRIYLAVLHSQFIVGLEAILIQCPQQSFRPSKFTLKLFGYTTLSGPLGEAMPQPHRIIKVPRNLTALMQHMLRLVTTGHTYYVSDGVPRAKLEGFFGKWEPVFALRADAPARAYRRRVGRASVHLCLHPEVLEASTTVVSWWMLSSAGKKGLLTASCVPGEVRDCRTLEGRLRCQDYELLEQTKSYTEPSGKVKTLTTWTWRISPVRYREWEALLVERARQRDAVQIKQLLECLRMMPMFAGVRAQVSRLAWETNKVLRKVGGAPVELTELPIMRMIKLWADEYEI
jgi:hypothetical protein